MADRDDALVDMLQLVQVGHGIVHITGRYRYIQNDAVVGIQRLMTQVVLPLRFSGPLHVPGFRIGPAHPLVAATAVLFYLLCPLLPPVAGLFLQYLQSFLLVCIQTLPVHTGFLGHLPQFLRRPGCVGLYMCGIRPHQPSADQSRCDALPYHFLEQTPEYLPERRVPPTQLRDRAVVRDPAVIPPTDTLPAPPDR